MDAIRAAARETGVDYNYLLAKAHLESGLNPKAKARTSSAAGLYQFIESTWLANLSRYEGQIRASDAGDVGTIAATTASRGERLMLRHDARLASFVAAIDAKEHGKQLEKILGRPANATQLYMAHFLGPRGAARFMKGWMRNPNAAAAQFFPKAARANRTIFYTGSGRARSLEDVLGYFDRKITQALEVLGSERMSSVHDINAFGEMLRSITDNRWAVQTSSSPLADQEQFSKVIQIQWPESGSSLPFAEHIVAQAQPVPEVQSNAFAGVGRTVRSAKGKGTALQQPPCNHIEMCYLAAMSTSTITKVRELIEAGAYTKAGIARAAGLHANTLRDASEPDWNPTADTLAKLQKFLDANDDRPVLVGAEEIIDEARNGRMYILVDDEDRENEGDLIIPAQMATPAAVNFMATHGRGLICLALDKARVDALGLDPMSRNNRESMQTAFTVSIEAKEGVTTGISAADRARTIAVAIDANKGPDDIVTPGHVFPLVAREGGTLVRAGHTEAAVDISRLAGLNPSGVICEIMNEDGSMARLDDLIEFARKHDMKIGTIRDLIAYRMRNDHLVERIGESSFESDYGGQWRMITYRNTVSDNEAYVLQKGHISPDEPTLARVHPISVFDDVLGAPGPRKRTLQRAMSAIGEKGAGVIVILTQRVGTSGKWTADEEHRNIGIGSQILADLGVHEMVLLSNSRPDLVALEGFGITLTGHQEIPE
ncbi:3,4-dihydroxy-2-butanone-4-phosphate synthase [Erythrobacter sp. SCSIO 43205]|nr:3,4-dihydroxy-2-butanone-4-phosphate synthase [Erythrobacter sp. SCSIO 43205]